MINENASNLKTEALRWIDNFFKADYKEQKKMQSEERLQKINSNIVALIYKSLIINPINENCLMLKQLFINLAFQRVQDSFRKQAMSRKLIHSDSSYIHDFLKNYFSVDGLKAKIKQWNFDKNGNFDEFSIKYELEKFPTYAEASQWIDAYFNAENIEQEKMLTEGRLVKISSDKVALVSQFLIKKPIYEHCLKLKDVYIHLVCQSVRDSFRKQAIRRNLIHSDSSYMDSFLDKKYSVKDVTDKLLKWDLCTHRSFTNFSTYYELKEFSTYLNERKEERLTDIVINNLNKFENENTNPDELDRIKSIFFAILLCIDELPHKKLILLHSMIFNLIQNKESKKKDKDKQSKKDKEKSKSISWEPWLISNLPKSLRDIGSEILKNNIDLDFQLIYSAYFGEYILKLKTTSLYLSSDYSELRAVVGDATIGEILIKYFLLKYYNKQEEFDYQRAIALLSTWKKRITKQIRDVFYDKQQSEKLKKFLGDYTDDR